jgi:hypothetical protein
MSRTLFGVSLASVVLSAGVWAQSNGAMRDSHAMKDMGQMKAATTTYVGCVESVNHDAQFLLIHVTAASTTTQSKGAGDMKDMKDTKMDAMKHDEMGKKSADMMAPTDLILKAPSIELRQYAGRRVSVTGSPVRDNATDKVPAFEVASIKLVANQCQ